VLHYGHGGAPSVFEIAAAASVFAAGYTCIAASGFDCTMLHCRVCKVIMYTRLLLLFVSQATPASPHQVQTVPCFTTAMAVLPTHVCLLLLLLLLFYLCFGLHLHRCIRFQRCRAALRPWWCPQR
jgi:hypothetical protein